MYNYAKQNAPDRANTSSTFSLRLFSREKTWKSGDESDHQEQLVYKMETEK